VHENGSNETAVIKPLSFTATEKQLETAEVTFKKNTTHPITKRSLVATLLFILIVGVVYWLQKDSPQTHMPLSLMAGEGCMYWTGDHYKQVSCNENHGDTLIVALDTFRLRHLKKINRPDTITQNAIGSIWYIKTNGVIEYFTAGGYYPLDPKRKLNVLTNYIFRKYSAGSK